jgi:membrane protein YdbS with pleckstrin-like domain
MNRKYRDWDGWIVDLGIVCFFVALPVACFSRTAALTLLISFMALTVIPMFKNRRKGG